MRSVFASTVCARRGSLVAELVVALIVQSDVKYGFTDAKYFSVSHLIAARFCNFFYVIPHNLLSVIYYLPVLFS